VREQTLNVRMLRSILPVEAVPDEWLELLPARAPTLKSVRPAGSDRRAAILVRSAGAGAQAARSASSRMRLAERGAPRSASRPSIADCSSARARARRERTVPIGQPSTLATCS